MTNKLLQDYPNWLNWLKQNIQRGCNQNELLEILLKNQFLQESVEKVFNESTYMNLQKESMGYGELQTKNDWNICVNRIERLMPQVIQSANFYLHAVSDVATKKKILALISRKVFSYIDTFGTYIEPEYPSHLQRVGLIPRSVTDHLSDKWSLGNALSNHIYKEVASKTFDTVRAALENLTSESPSIYFIKGRWGTSGEQVQCISRCDLQKLELPENYVIQEGIENIQLFHGRKMVFRFYVLIFNKKIFLFTNAIAIVHASKYIPQSTDYEVQIKHSGYHLKDSKVELFPIDQLHNGSNFIEQLKLTVQTILPILERVKSYSSESEYQLLGIDGIPCEDHRVKIIEINTYPNLIHTPYINEMVNVPVLTSMMLQVICKVQLENLKEITDSLRLNL